MMVTWAEMPRSPDHAFYDRLQAELIKAGFDGFVEGLCAPLYAARRGRPSLPPGRYFRMLLVGYFEGIDSERGLEWRCADSLSLREFLRLGDRAPVPDHSWLSRTRSRLPLELHDQGFTWVLQCRSPIASPCPSPGPTTRPGAPAPACRATSPSRPSRRSRLPRSRPR